MYWKSFLGIVEYFWMHIWVLPVDMAKIDSNLVILISIFPDSTWMFCEELSTSIRTDVLIVKKCNERKLMQLGTCLLLLVVTTTGLQQKIEAIKFMDVTSDRFGINTRQVWAIGFSKGYRRNEKKEGEAVSRDREKAQSFSCWMAIYLTVLVVCKHRCVSINLKLSPIPEFHGLKFHL